MKFQYLASRTCVKLLYKPHPHDLGRRGINWESSASKKFSVKMICKKFVPLFININKCTLFKKEQIA